jgi:FkbM family methyltransferase
MIRRMRLPDNSSAQEAFAELLSYPSAEGPRSLEGPFALYGAGKLGLMAMTFFEHVQLKPDLVIDANADRLRDSAAWRRWPMQDPLHVPMRLKRSLPLVVSIATTCFAELAAGLKAQGWRDVIPIYDVTEAYRTRYPLGNGWFMGELTGTERSATEQVLAAWSDDVSRAHHLQFMAWHRLRQDWLFEGAPVEMAHRYFIPEVSSVLGDREVFVDAGAHTGETAKAFREKVGNRFAEIIMFEPDSGNASLIEAGLEQLPGAIRPRHRLLRRALSHASGRQPFFPQLGYGSQLSLLGADMVDAIALDDMEVAPTYIKLHLEGHELDALRGAERSLLLYRPIVSVTTYHSDTGLWKLPSWLMGRMADYRFYLRLHSWCGTGAVMYCVPAERIGARSNPKVSSWGERR